MALLTRLPFLLLAAAASIVATDAFATLPYRAAYQPVARSLQSNRAVSTSPSTALHLSEHDETEGLSSSETKLYTPLDRPLLALVDTVCLVVFAAIGKSSHSADGSLDLSAVLVTAFPFISAWLATSPLTGVYSPDSREGNVLASTATKVGKGWVAAVPLGIALRGVIKGYVPPTPFIIVTLVTTLVILAGGRILFGVVEDFFVELV